MSRKSAAVADVWRDGVPYAFFEAMGCVAVQAIDLYTDMFRLGDGFIQQNGEKGKLKANPIAYYRNESEPAGHFRIMFEDEFDDLLLTLQEADFAIMNGITYFGRRNEQAHASKMYALIFDLDGITEQKLRNFFKQCSGGVIPSPNYIVLSGHGLHLYYIFEQPLSLFPNIKLQVKELKYALTRRIWNKYTSTLEEPQYQGINQGFRVAGGKTKRGCSFAYSVVFRYRKDFFSMAELNQFVPKDSQIDEQKIFKETKYTLEDAKKRFPEWYWRMLPTSRALIEYAKDMGISDDTYVLKNCSELDSSQLDLPCVPCSSDNDFVVRTVFLDFITKYDINATIASSDKYLRYADKVVIEYIDTAGGRKFPANRKKWDIAGKVHGDNPFALYDWWLDQIKTGASFGHRYFCVMMLAIYAVKCDVPKERLDQDAAELIPYLNALGDEPFTAADVESALECYDDRYATFPLRDIEKLSAIEIPRNTRNGRSQEMHLLGVRAALNARNPNWRNTEGRPSNEQTVAEWREKNPRGTRQECAADLGITERTVRKWWGKCENCTVVYEWRQLHPDGRKAACVRDTGLSKPTVYKWWDYDPSSIADTNPALSTVMTPDPDWHMELPEYYVVDGAPDMMERMLAYATAGVRSVEILSKDEYEYLLQKRAENVTFAESDVTDEIKSQATRHGVTLNTVPDDQYQVDMTMQWLASIASSSDDEQQSL